MTSMRCQKQPGGQVHVHDSGLVESLVIDSQDQISTIMSRNSSMRKRPDRPNTTPAASRNMDSSSLIGHTMRVQHWLNEKTVKTLQEKSDLETKAARKLYTPLLEAENTFVRDVGNFIENKEVTNLRKKEVLHKKWTERVYKPLRKKIIEAMDSHDWPEVDRRKRELHKQYLEFTNEKGHVFLETMDPEEYYAMALNGHRPAPIKRCLRCARQKQYANRRIPREVELEPIHFLPVMETKKVDAPVTVTVVFDTQTLHWNLFYPPEPCVGVPSTQTNPLSVSRAPLHTGQVETRPLHDPLVSQGRERNEEERTILRCLTGHRYTDRDIEQIKLPMMPLVPLGRHGTDSTRWLEMPLSNIESGPRLASRRRMRGIFNKTQVDFGEWSKTPYNHDMVDRELQIQKKRMYSEDEKPPFRKPPRRRLQLKPTQMSVSFQSPVATEETLAVQPVTQQLQQISLAVGTD